MIVITDTTLILESKYPLRRKFCSSCGRWRHIADYSLNVQRKKGKPYTRLESSCRGCRNKAASKTGRTQFDPRTDAERQAISAAQRARLAPLRDLPQPDKRRCSRCHTWKRTVADFAWKRRRLADGSFTHNPSSWCKACEAERQRLKREAMGKDALHAAQKRWRENRKKDNTSTMRDFIMVSAAPIAAWLDDEDNLPEAWTTLRQRASIDSERGARLRDPSAQVPLEHVDRLLRAAGAEHLLPLLYPAS